MLKKKGIVVNKKGKAYKFFTQFITPKFTDLANLTPSEYVNEWNHILFFLYKSNTLLVMIAGYCYLTVAR